jgi:lipopolysaccharide transport system ATP-binding protein
MVSALRIESLSKRYFVNHEDHRGAGSYRTMRESLAELASAPLRGMRGHKRVTREEFWALKDVEFDVEPGEVLGIIGRNGAGKSTLLKVLSRITRPTRGRVVVNGRVSSLLEVGTGFHPELTGRENIYLNGSILGMRRAEIDRRFDEIVAFAEIEQFLDTPVKRYSSGMYVRLAFAIAAHLNPEVLIIDEVLAVGDTAFQRKCLGCMESFGKAGRTVLFVSHDLNAVAKLTTRSLLLERGRLTLAGKTPAVIHAYLRYSEGYASEWHRQSPPHPDRPTIVKIVARNRELQPSAIFDADQPFQIELHCRFPRPIEAQLAFRLNSDAQVETVFTTSLSDGRDRAARFPPGDVCARCTIPANLLVPGRYHVLAALNNFKGPQFDMVERALAFEVTEVGSLTRYDGRLGKVAPLLEWTCQAGGAAAANPLALAGDAC